MFVFCFVMFGSFIVGQLPINIHTKGRCCLRVCPVLEGMAVLLKKDFLKDLLLAG